MGRTKGAKDNKKRSRRKMTANDKARRNEAKIKKRKQEKKQKTAAFMSSFHGPPPVAETAGDEHPEEELEEPSICYEEVTEANACNGTMDLGEFQSLFDDDYDNDDDGSNASIGPGGSIMKEYLRSIMKRFQLEASPNFKKDHPDDHEWLHEYLKDHGYWIRSECCHFMCKKLGIRCRETAYYRDIRVWFPDLEGGQLCMPACVTCGRNDRVRAHSYPMDHPARRVVAFETHYYIMSRQYLCRGCQADHKERKDKANGEPFEKIQYTMMGSLPEVLRRLPDDMYYKFPAVLTHRAGLDRSLVRSLRPLSDKGLRPEGIASLLLELHALKYTDDVISYELRLERELAFLPEATRPMFSKFDDRNLYNGAVPSGSYLSEVYKSQHEKIRPQLDREMKKVSVDQFSIDASAKAPKKLSQYNGKRMYETLQSGMNEIGQFRVQVLTGSDSHEQLEPALNAMRCTLEEQGKEGPRIVFSDNPARDKAFLMKELPSLRKTQDELDQFAAQLNDNVTPPAAPTDGNDASPPTLNDNDSGTTAIPNSDSASSDELSECIQVIAPQSINNKIESLREQMEAASDGRAVYGFDCEWDTVPTNDGKGRRKVGKVALMQIAYKLDDGVIRAFLLQLPKSGKLPGRLEAFLKDKKSLFVGFNIKNDFDIVGKDFSLPRLSDDVNFTSLGMMARERDVVQRGNHSLEYVVEAVTGFKIDKSEDVRCSKWSNRNLTNRQQRYAALDVIKPLEVYETLLELPDLSQRIDPDDAKPGLLVDIVPPHARNNRLRALRGYAVGDLATRGAIGRIVDDSTVSNPSNIKPQHAKTNSDQRVVEVTTVLAPSLCVPGHTIGKEKTKACLGDFDKGGKSSFRVVLPLTMLRKHEASSQVRTYDQRIVLPIPTHRRITPPAPSKCPVVNDLHDADAEDDFDEDLFNLIDDVDVDGSDPIGEDAGKELRKEHLDTIAEAEVAAEETQKEGNAELLYCDNLDVPPDLIEQVFSCVLGDIFHAMNRAKVPVKHEYKKAYFVALMKAFLLWDENRLNEVIGKLKENGWSDEDVEAALYFRPGFFRQRVERIALPPRELYWRVRAVFVTFGSKQDSKTGQPLFNKAAWAKANNLLKEILLGFYSDPPGFNFYRLQLDSEGKPKVDKYGIQLVHCNRGTNDVENGHKHYHTIFRYTAGIELGDCLLAERRHRHNIRMAETRIPDYPRLGHFNTWQIDKLQILVEKNHGILLYPTWINAADWRDTNESFVTVAIHSEALHEALRARAENISEEVKDGYSGDLRFLCNQLGVPIPFLPVDGEAEYRLFTHLLLHELESFDENKMAFKWMEHVDGEKIFPKLPHQLRKYHKQWERNRRVQDAVKNMKSEIDVLNSLNKEQVPAELEAVPMAEEGSDDDAIVGAVDDIYNTTGSLLSFPRAVLPPPMQFPPVQAFHGNGGRGVYVDLEWIGETVMPEALPPVKRSKGNRGCDKKKRKIRHCHYCKSFLTHLDDAQRLELAGQCTGRNNRSTCERFLENGTRK